MTIIARKLAFLDPSIADWQTLAEGLNEGIELVFLDPAQDALWQVAGVPAPTV